MLDRQWSRSRFWLCHFLHNRHERATIEWESSSSAPVALGQAMRRWRCGIEAGGLDGRKWLIAAALRRYASDPAYIQSLRLFVKEQQHHATLLARTLERVEPASPPIGPWRAGLDRALTVGRRWIGIRFELSVLLLSQLIAVLLCRMIQAATGDPAVRGVSGQIMRDTRAHAAFHAERLTMEFADFNFIRRNLRRWRLRLMFAAALGVSAVRYGPLIRAAGWTRRRFCAEGWRQFTLLLENMVPYHRDALLAALLNQREQPFKEPGAMSGEWDF